MYPYILLYIFNLSLIYLILFFNVTTSLELLLFLYLMSVLKAISPWAFEVFTPPWVEWRKGNGESGEDIRCLAES
jgi:hypothetical protein